jgi:hypothetical protein
MWAHRCLPPRTIGCCSLCRCISGPISSKGATQNVIYGHGGLRVRLVSHAHTLISHIPRTLIILPPPSVVQSFLQCRRSSGEHARGIIQCLLLALRQRNRRGSHVREMPHRVLLFPGYQIANTKEDSDRFVLTCACAHSRSMRDIGRCTDPLTCANVFPRVITHECAHTRVPSNFLAAVPQVRTG